MKAPTHLAFGLLCATSVFSLAARSLPSDGPALGGVVLGSLLPDLDSSKSTLGRVLPFVSLPIEQRWGHRTLTHSLLVLGGLGVVLLASAGIVATLCYRPVPVKKVVPSRRPLKNPC